MKLKTIAKRVSLSFVAGAAALGLAFSGATAASANPETPRSINLFGSDTTQDVMNGVAFESLIGNEKYIGSWNAGTTAAASPINPAPNGSGAGLSALRLALNGTTGYAGKIQAARSSSSPKASELSTTGELQYVPFARDAVTYATAATSSVPNNIPITAAAGKLSLQAIFTCAPGTFEHGGKNYHTVGNPAGSTKLIPINLQANSGTRSFWAGAVGYSGSCLSGDAQEHNGQDIAASPFALAPFSISQWIAQSNAGAANQNGTVGTALGIPVEDRRWGVKLNSVGTGPASNPIAAGVQNPGFVGTLTRNVFNVIPTDAVLNPIVSVENVLLNAAFVGPQAASSNATIIEKFGFSTALKDGYAPGATPAGLRVKLNP